MSRGSQRSVFLLHSLKGLDFEMQTFAQETWGCLVSCFRVHITGNENHFWSILKYSSYDEVVLHQKALHPHLCVHKEIKGNLIHSLPCMNIVFIKHMESERVDQINKCRGSGSDHTEMHCYRCCCFKNTLEKLDSSKTMHLHLELCAITVLAYVFTYIFVLKSV